MFDRRYMFSDYHYKFEDENQTRDYLNAQIGKFIPNYFLTITMHPYSKIFEIDRVISEFAESHQRFPKEVVNRVDYKMYGRKHARMPKSEKYSFITRLETKSRNNTRVLPHFHMYMGNMDFDLQDQVDDLRDDIMKSLRKLCYQMGFQPNIDFRRHDVSENDYILKFPLADIQHIDWRNACPPIEDPH
ncbi:hypothetical protein GCM10009069_27600 [Algimonas arctica]|uniref:Uncharacterized protein n=1 Tax=Algimonas arctica TaxID=1479486 RepID=A0A8J3CT55_9PROT|nr:hypothetical protein [Algimonas arctica]GHB03386.1 hypothetical protein GCM10009069_27600 [Algimonas arctica]